MEGWGSLGAGGGGWGGQQLVSGCDYGVDIGGKRCKVVVTYGGLSCD